MILSTVKEIGKTYKRITISIDILGIPKDYLNQFVPIKILHSERKRQRKEREDRELALIRAYKRKRLECL